WVPNYLSLPCSLPLPGLSGLAPPLSELAAPASGGAVSLLPLPLPLSYFSDLSLSLPWPCSDSWAGGSATGAGVGSVGSVVDCGVRSSFSGVPVSAGGAAGGVGTGTLAAGRSVGSG